MEGIIKYQSQWENKNCIAEQEVEQLDAARHKIWQQRWIGEDDGIGLQIK